MQMQKSKLKYVVVVLAALAAELFGPALSGAAHANAHQPAAQVESVSR
jgi:hypothetical protein